jgi:predicted aminopeptidase
MLRGDHEGIVNLVLHEAAHGVLYWKGQTDFNESFASFVGDVGAVMYLEDRLGPDCEPCARARTARADAPRFSALISEVVERLNHLYDEPVSRDDKLRRREQEFHRAKERYREITWEGDTYDYFLQRDLDNAVILSYQRYDSGQGLFDALLARCDEDLIAAIRFVQHLDWPGLPGARRREVSPMDLLQEKLDEGLPCR